MAKLDCGKNREHEIESVDGWRRFWDSIGG